MTNPQTKKFSYQVDVDAVPLNSDTTEYYFGKGATFNPDYPEDTFGQDILFDMVKDAITYVLQAKSSYLARTKLTDEQLSSDHFWQHLEEKEKQYRQIEKSIKRLPKE